MDITLDISKTLLASCQKIVKSTNNKKFTIGLQSNLKISIQQVIDFYNVEQFEAILLSYFIHQSVKRNEPSVQDLIRHFNNDTTILPEILLSIEKLIQKDYIVIAKKSKIEGEEIYNSYKLNQRVLQATISGNSTLLSLQSYPKFENVLDEMAVLLEMTEDNVITPNHLAEEFLKLLSVNNHFREIEWVDSWELTFFEKLTLYALIVSDCIYQRIAVDFNDLLNVLFENRIEKYKFKKIIFNQSSNLIKRKLIEVSINSYGVTLANLTYKVKNTFSKEDTIIVANNIKKHSKGTYISSKNIKEETLFYNEAELQQIEILKKSLAHSNYKKLCKQLKSNNFNNGFTVLLYGMTGTGKTATVHQLAKYTGRDIYMVSTEKIMDMYVGESEKNIVSAFNEYKTLYEQLTVKPILLFNEADGILSRRTTVTRSSDKHSNALQNVLLQQLEDFEGIFIATTNLASSLDEAFDRRFLYKIEYKTPEPKVQLQILSKAFPNVELDVLNNINSNYNLTGAQIANIKKKMLIQSFLVASNASNLLIKTCEEEIAKYRQTTKNKIGFI